MIRSPDPELDLTMARIIKAPRATVWRAWSDPTRLEQWWVPEPARCKVIDMDLRPGGSFVTRISEGGGAFLPHIDACFLAVDEFSRIVFTDTLVAGWRPAENAFMTAIITLSDHPAGTEYAAHVMHRSGADRKMHEEMGFHDGWGTVAGQLARFVEQTH
ncbi:SRPBCC family protein [Ensifer adhaerens]|uniref:SRPBCC family protein n=1 Tax=Ensifer adhaerens TaxID=106592 RepID=UPI000DE472E8|nr:SRPBCC family protein [Ensifer adhaerens]MBW0366319.1 SRPBCC family protein [Ensifer adhaerens]UCM19795.1 SRPBCC family protein [Ensifer adhaerens]